MKNGLISGKRFDNLQDEKKLVQWENILADTYLTKVEAKEADSVDGRVKVIMHRSAYELVVCVCVFNKGGRGVARRELVS